MGVTNTTNYNLIKPNIYEELDAWGTHSNTNWDSVDGIMKTNETAAATASAEAATADGKAVAAQADATQALADAATADGKAVAAQGDATQALADAAAAQSTANTADGKADANTTNKAPLDSPAFTTTATLDGAALATEPYAKGQTERPAWFHDDTNVTLDVADYYGRTHCMRGLTAARTVTLVNTAAQAAFPQGARMNIVNYDAGDTHDVTIVAGTGVTLHSKDSNVIVRGAYAGVTVEKMDDNTWMLIGDLSAA
jgi:hypothetical protein